MTLEEKEQRAAEYAIGTLDAGEREQVALDMLRDPELAAAVAAWERRLAPLADGLPEEAPDAGLWSRIVARIDEAPSVSTVATTVYAEEGAWLPVAPGIEAKVLHVDRAQRMRSCLIRCAPDTRLAAHPHARAEECLMLEGDLSFGSLTLGPGDFHVIPAGTPHPEGYTRGGCLLFLRGDLLAKVA